MSLTYSKSSISNKNRFDDDVAPAKAFVVELLYRTAGRLLHGTPLIISGPAYSRHVRNGFDHISRKPFVSEECIVLIDRDEDVGRILWEKRQQHAMVDVEKASKVKLLLGKRRGDVLNAKPYRFEDLDLMETWNGNKLSGGPSAGEIFCARLKGQLNRWPSKRFYKGIIFTVVLRNSSGGKYELVKGLNELLGVIGSSINGFEFTAGYTNSPWDSISPVHPTLGVYEQTPVIRCKGRLVKMRVFTYKDGTPMLTGVIIWR